MVDNGDYFTINRGRQFGKTTTLTALAEYLKKDYEVVSLDFQTMDALTFDSVQNFVATFAEELLDSMEAFPEGIEERLQAFSDGTTRLNSLNALFRVIKDWCGKLDRGLVLMIRTGSRHGQRMVYWKRYVFCCRRKTPCLIPCLKS